MKYFVLLAAGAVSLAALVASPAQADVVSTTATLVPADPAPSGAGGVGLANNIQIALPNLALADTSGNQATDYIEVTGSFDIALDYDPFTGIVSSFAIDYAPQSLAGSGFTINLFGGISAQSSTLGLSTGADPLADPTGLFVPVNGAGEYDATQASAVLDGGEVVALGSVAIDLTNDPIQADGGPDDIQAGGASWTGDPVYPFPNPTNPGPGTLVLTPDGVGGWDFLFSFPIATGTEVLPGAVLTLQNSIVATGNVPGASIIPEPTSGLFLASLMVGAGAVVRRRRK